MSNEYLTMAEIEKRYPNEWVLIDRPNSTRLHEVLGGYVVAHSPDRDEFDRMTLSTIPALSKRVASLYTGKPDPNEVWML